MPEGADRGPLRVQLVTTEGRGDDGACRSRPTRARARLALRFAAAGGEVILAFRTVVKRARLRHNREELDPGPSHD